MAHTYKTRHIYDFFFFIYTHKTIIIFTKLYYLKIKIWRDINKHMIRINNKKFSLQNFHLT